MPGSLLAGFSLAGRVAGTVASSSVDNNTKQRHPGILLIGAPGAGKGTQGKVLGAVPRFYHCACGDVFRSLDTRTELGQRFVHYSSKGELVPDELTIDLWKAQLDNWIETYVYKPDIDILLLDGIPRNVRQAEILDDYLEVHRVFHLTCPNRDELGRRMRKRALKDNRYDDASDEVISHRIKTYEAETRPLVEHYSGIVSKIDGTKPPVEVLGQIIEEVIKLDIYHQMAKITV